MKTKLLIIFLFLQAIAVKAQFISFDELILLQKKDLTEINDFLTLRGWDFSTSEEETETTLSKAIWAFGRTEWEEGKAQAWFYLFSKQGNENRIIYQIHNRTNYNKIFARIKSLGMKKIKSEVLDNTIYSDYEGKNFIVRILQSSEENETVTTYQFQIFTKDDYLSMMLNEIIDKQNSETENR